MLPNVMHFDSGLESSNKHTSLMKSENVVRCSSSTDYWLISIFFEARLVLTSIAWWSRWKKRGLSLKNSKMHMKITCKTNGRSAGERSAQLNGVSAKCSVL